MALAATRLYLSPRHRSALRAAIISPAVAHAAPRAQESKTRHVRTVKIVSHCPQCKLREILQCLLDLARFASRAAPQRVIDALVWPGSGLTGKLRISILQL